MALHLIQSQRIEVLVDAMLAHLQAQPLPVLQPRHFIVPSKAVEEWLMQRMAEKQGVSANTQFHQRIRGFQWAAYQWVLQDRRDEVRKANIPRIIMQWKVFHCLQRYIQQEHNPLEKNHALYQLIQRIYDSADRLPDGLEKQLKKQNMLYWVAEKISRLFNNYMIYRGFCQYACAGTAECTHNWLEAWGNDRCLDVEELIYRPHHFLDEDERLAAEKIAEFTQEQAEQIEAWQRWIWRSIFHQDFQEMQRIDELFWQALGTPDAPSKMVKVLPQQLTIFTLLDLPPSQLYFIRRLAQYIDIHVLHYNPSQEYWADMVDPKWKAKVDARIKDRFIQQKQQKGHQVSDAEIQAYIEKYNGRFNADMRESHHPLLTRFGKQARDHFSLLSVLSSGEEGEWYDYFPETETRHLLSKIQADILHLAEPESHAYHLAEDDDSIQIHVCHSSQRQLEVLKDQLIHWLAQDESRQPRDILVLSPNLKDQESAIRSVFAPPPSERDVQVKGQLQHDLSQDTVYLPIQIAGISSLDANNAWRAVLGRIQLVDGRFSLEEFSDWLSLAATQQRYALDLNRIERMIELLKDAGFKRGLDATHLGRSLVQGDEDYRYTLKFALDRLAMGIAVPEHCMVNNTLSYAQVLPSDFELINILIEIYQHLAARQNWMIEHEQTEVIQRRVEDWLNVLMQEVYEFQEAGVDALAPVYKLLFKHERLLTLASYFEDELNQDLRKLHLPLPYIVQEISSQLDTQMEQAMPSGAITFSQIGTIRPLPYKLIVMLNLDSGTFPNRDQQLPFDLMSLLKPQLGDRSRMEDDQGAFLDALLLAQDNLWLFYNGFDMSDGEVRDPSSVLSELLQHLSFIVEQPTDNASDMVSLEGIEVPAHLQSLYRLHPLQPFDVAAFTQPNVPRYQDQWYRVAMQMRQAKTPREHWFTEYPRLEQDLIVLDSQPWIDDVVFPARAYLKAIDVEQMNVSEAVSQHEPLLLDGLQRYQVRDFLLQHRIDETPMQLLQHHLPVGKTQQATWHHSVQEQQYLRERLNQYTTIESAVTQRVWKISPQLQINIRVPQQQEQQWCSIMAASASAKRYAKVWLEYILWLAYLNLGSSGQDYERIVVCSNQTIHFKGISSDQAQKYIQDWLAFWQVAQQQPVILPAELVLNMNNKQEFVIQWQEDDTTQVENLEHFLKLWQDPGWHKSGKESSLQDPAWAFIFQDAETAPMLTQAFAHYSHLLYAPLIEHRVMSETV